MPAMTLPCGKWKVEIGHSETWCENGFKVKRQTYCTGAQMLFFRPTPSRLSPGRYTRSIVAKDELTLSCKGCQLSIATKVLVMDLYAVQYAIPARKPKTQNKPHQAKTKQPKKHQEVGSQPAWRFVHDDILCVMMIMALNQKQNREPRQKHQGPNQRV